MEGDAAAATGDVEEAMVEAADEGEVAVEIAAPPSALVTADNESSSPAAAVS